MKVNKIYFRVDGGAKVGHGHFVRCVSLAKILSRSYEICFASIEISSLMELELLDLNFNFIKLINNNDFLQIVKIDDVVIIDNYNITSNYLRDLKLKVYRLISIDDLHDKFFNSDLVINHTPGITIDDYRCDESTMLALGPKYALLRSSFIDAANFSRNIENLTTVLICFGGSDINNFTHKTAEILVKCCLFKTINIIIGSTYQYKNEIVQFAKENPNVVLWVNLNENEMCELMKTTDLSIVPASTVLFESIACGMLTIVCYYVDNQKLLHNYVVENLNVPSFSDGLNPNFEKLETILENKNIILNQNTKIIRSEISFATNNLFNIINNILN